MLKGDEEAPTLGHRWRYPHEELTGGPSLHVAGGEQSQREAGLLIPIGEVRGRVNGGPSVG
jgi:hypothetical protein